jgi:hypothetical protein
MRPSSNCAEIASSDTATLSIRASTFSALILRLQNPHDVTEHLSTNLIQLRCGEAVVPSQRDRNEPLLVDPVLTLHVHMFRLISVEAVKEEPVAARSVLDHGTARASGACTARRRRKAKILLDNSSRKITCEPTIL